jgi:hypothetical protein
MEKEPYIDIGDPLSKQAWQKEQVVIMNPDNVTFLIILHDAVGEQLVQPDIICPPPSL